jgi:hypothetical protein
MEVGSSVPVALPKQKQVQRRVGRYKMSLYRDADIDEECREETMSPEKDTPEESREGSREDAEVFIEAEFETALEADFIPNTRKGEAQLITPKSQSMHNPMALSSVLSERILTPMDDEFSQYGVEIEFGRPRTHYFEEASSNDVEDEKSGQSEESTVEEVEEEPQETSSIKANEDASVTPSEDVKQEFVEDEHPSLSSNDDTWSFDTNLKRKKAKTGTKSKISQNVFAGFSEEGEINAEDEATDVEKEEARVDGNEEIQEEPVGECEEPQETEEITEEPTSNMEEHEVPTEDSHPIATDSTESAEEDTGVSAFGAILENVAEHMENGDWDAFIEEVAARPSLATFSSVDFFPSECTGFLAVGASNNLLLHEVCKNEPTVEAVTTLLEVHDAAVRTSGQWGYLPIHCACAAGSSKGVIDALLKAHPESIKSFGDDHRFPLHLACKRGSSMEIFQLLIDAHPSACAAKDVYGKTPMDYASSQPEGHERAQKLEILGRHAQSMVLSTVDVETQLRESTKKSLSIRKELVEKREKVLGLEKDLKEFQDKTLSLQGDLKEKDNRTSDLAEQLKTNQGKVAELETELSVERAKASVFGENLKKELAKSSALESELGRERARSSSLATEMQTNADDWAALGVEMEEEFKKSSAELTKERKRITRLEKELKKERKHNLVYETRLHQHLVEVSSIDGSVDDGKEKVNFIQEKLAEAKLRWLIEKQEIYERDDANLAEAYELLVESMAEANSNTASGEAAAMSNATQQKEAWLLERNEIIDKNDTHMAAAYKVVEDIEGELKDKHTNNLLERQAIYEKVEGQLNQAYKIICKTEINLKQERTKWLLERQTILERNDENMAQAFMVMRDTEMSLAAKKFQLQEHETALDKREKEIKEQHAKSKNLIRRLELAKAISGEKLDALVDELNLQKSFTESQTKQIEALETSIDLKLSDVNEYAKGQQERLVYEKSITDNIMEKINEKKKLMKENQEMISVLDKSNIMKEDLLEAQQKKVEGLEAGRREKEAQLKLNQKAMKQLEESIAEKRALEKLETTQASKLAGSRASRKAAIDIEEDQIKELDYTLARKQALIELEKMKEKTLQQTIAQKHELIEAEVARIKDLELLIAEKETHLATERKTIKELKASNTEKVSLLASEKQVIEQLRKTQEEKEKVLEAQKETEAVIRSHLKEEETLLASKQAAVEGAKEARITIEKELKIQKDTTTALEQQIVRKESLITKEEYVAKCLKHLSMHKREFMPPGAISYFVNSYFGVEYKAHSSMNFIIRETNLASNFVKTHIREQYTAVQRRRDESLASVSAAVRKRRDLVSTAVRKRRDEVSTAVCKRRDEVSTAVCKRRDEALALIPDMPTMPSLPSVGPQSLVARLKSFGVNVDLFPKDYGVTKPTAEDEAAAPAPTPAPVETAPVEKKQPSPESKWRKLTNWTK